MDKIPLTPGASTENSPATGPVTRETEVARARELARLAGDAPAPVRQSDYEQAKRELADEPDLDAQDAVLESLPETKRWDLVPGSTGHQVRESPSDDEDDEGRSETEQLVDEGAMEAERDRMLQAARLTEKTNRHEP